MITLIFVILMLIVFGKMLGFAIKMAWGAAKIIFGIILLPVVIIALFASGFIVVALGILIIAGIGSLLLSVAKA